MIIKRQLELAMFDDDLTWNLPRPVTCPNCKKPVEGSGAYCDRCPQDLVSEKKDAFGVQFTDYCLWCGEENPFSKEDIFPTWLSSKFPVRAKTKININRIRKAAKLSLFQPDAEYFIAPKRDKHRGAYELVIHEVCTTCNNGWMSRLQAKMKPLILRLNRGVDVSLIAAERDLISQWVFMTAVNIGAADRFTESLPGTRKGLLKGALPVSEMGCAVLSGIGIMGDASCGGFYGRYDTAIPMGMGGKPYSAISAGWIIIERVAFGYLMAPTASTLSLLRYTAGPDGRDQLKGAGLTCVNLPDRPLSVENRTLTLASLRTLDIRKA